MPSLQPTPTAMNEAFIDNHDRRIFRARFKIQHPGLISHITQRAAGKEPLFLEKSDYLRMLALLKECAEKFKISFFAFCLMPNHVHLLIKPEKKNLAKAMHSIFSRYAAWFNKKYQRKGHLFGGPYRQAACLDNPYFLTASVYIHLNPVRADLCDDPRAYRWSSCALYGPDPSPQSFVDPGPVLRLLDKNEKSARKEYNRILEKDEVFDAADNILEQEGAIEKFCLRLAAVFPRLFNRVRSEGKSSNKDALMDVVSLDELLGQALKNSSRSPETRMARKHLLEQLLARGFKQSEIAAKMGVSRKTVYNILNA